MTPDQMSCIRYLMDEMDPSEKMAFEREVAQSSDLQIELESMKATYARLSKTKMMDAPDHVQAHVEHLAFLQAQKKRRTKGQALWMRAAAILAMAVLPASYLAWQWDGGNSDASSVEPIADETRSVGGVNGASVGTDGLSGSANQANQASRAANRTDAYASQQGWLNESNTIQMVNQPQSPNRVIPWQSTWSLAPKAAAFATPDVHPSGSPLFDSLYQDSYNKLRRVQSTPLTPSMNNSVQLVGARRP
ncbi:MAG: hypothetical protein RI513_04535 [Balneolaceae bacterium]|nr:hypothetical protein [Balneolaceae bacterium]